MNERLERKLRYGTQFHADIVQAIKQRYTLSSNELSDRHDKWREDEEQYVAYIPETEANAIRRQRRKEGKPQQTTLMLPYTYAIVMTLHTYLTSVFLGGRDPILQYEGRHGEGEHAKLAIESLMGYQMRTGGALVPMYIWLMDLCKYGIGVSGLFWDEEVSYVVNEQEVPVTFLGLPIAGKTKMEEVEEEITGYVGNRMYNVRPFNWFPDPRVPSLKFQDGEFCIIETDEMPIIDLQSGDFINKEAALRIRRNGTKSEQQSHTQEMPEYEEETSLPEMAKNVGTGNLKEAYINLIPKDWGLADRERPEKWVFLLWNDKVIIDAGPTGLYHGKFPLNTLEYEVEGYQLGKRAVSEIIAPLQNLLDWLVNTHMTSIRKVINDQLVVDPSMVVMKDVTDPGEGKIIRARPKAYGSPHLDKAVHQLRVADVTQTHMNDAGLVMEMMQRASGVTDQIMGMIQRGGRPTAQQVRTETAFGVNRVKTVAEWNSALGFSPFAQMMLQHSQQFYDMEQKFKIAGDSITLRGAEKFLMVKPEDIAGFWDYLPVDGTLPVDRYAQANLWRELLASAATIPGVLEQYDLGGIFAWVAQLAGLKGVQNFKLQVTDFEILKAQVAAGNVVPTSGVQSGPAEGASPDTRFEDRAGSVGEPGQVSGMGTTG